MAAQAAGATLACYPIAAKGPGGEALSIDVACLGEAFASRTLVLSSGLHGVEGYAGSAIQTAWLKSLTDAKADGPPPGVRIVLIHALNPYGLAWRRRVNENNVDLNRNFLLPGETYAGAPAEVRTLDGFINPGTPPDPPWLAWRYWPQAAFVIARYGMATLRAALTQGQYDFPDGLFFGGRAPEESTRIVRSHWMSWTGDAAFVLHLDLHTGLGPRGRCTLLSGGAPGQAQWLAAHFPGRHVEPSDTGINTAVRGGMGTALASMMAAAKRHYVFATIEFGTCAGVHALRALREENRAHRCPATTEALHERAKQRLMNCFSPAIVAWQTQVAAQGAALCAQALAVSTQEFARSH